MLRLASLTRPRRSPSPARSVVRAEYACFFFSFYYVFLQYQYKQVRRETSGLELDPFVLFAYWLNANCANAFMLVEGVQGLANAMHGEHAARRSRPFARETRATQCCVQVLSTKHERFIPTGVAYGGFLGAFELADRRRSVYERSVFA